MRLSVPFSTVLILVAALSTSCARSEPVYKETDPPGTSSSVLEEPIEHHMTIDLLIKNKRFQADIADSETGRAFLSLLPMSLHMSELNGNEKYRHLSADLPEKAQHYDSIATGDLMLFQGNCLVLFYDSSGGYSYTRIGRLRDTGDLREAVGSGDITIEFRKTE